MSPTGPAHFPGATAVSQLRVYDWPAADGQRGGSPHLHTASAEGYVVLSGSGTLETLSSAGYAEHPLAAGTVLWFTPGTVHRLVTGGELEILVVMQNSGLPEAGDAVLTFPTDVLADPAAYAAVAALPGPAALREVEGGPTPAANPDEDALAAAARKRRDLAIEGYLPLRDRVRSQGPAALEELWTLSAALVRHRVEAWRELWHDRALAEAVRTGEDLRRLAEGDGGHLATSAVHTAEAAPGPQRFGMCGRLQVWNVG